RRSRGVLADWPGVSQRSSPCRLRALASKLDNCLTIATILPNLIFRAQVGIRSQRRVKGRLGMNDHATGRSGPLTGLPLIDCSWGTGGPRATGMLADYGADVIRVEPPGGDPYRAELAVAYSAFNRGKRSIVLDLRTDTDRDVLLRLIGSADVFVQSWRPGVAERLGVGYDTIRRLSPPVGHCSLLGVGPAGP